MAGSIVWLDGWYTLRSESKTTPSHLPGGPGVPLPRDQGRAATETRALRRPDRASLPHPLCPGCGRGRSRSGPGARCESGQPASLAQTLRGGRHRGAPTSATRPFAAAAASLGRADRHRGATADVLEQQAPGRGVHATGHLPPRPQRGRSCPRRAGHGASLVPPTTWPGLRTQPARRALAHRHQGSLLPAACTRGLHQGLDRGPRGRPLPLPHRAAGAAPAPDRAHPHLAGRLLRAVRAAARGDERQRLSLRDLDARRAHTLRGPSPSCTSSTSARR
jgi:hypothetical protein